MSVPASVTNGDDHRDDDRRPKISAAWTALPSPAQVVALPRTTNEITTSQRVTTNSSTMVTKPSSPLPSPVPPPPPQPQPPSSSMITPVAPPSVMPPLSTPVTLTVSPTARMADPLPLHHPHQPSLHDSDRGGRANAYRLHEPETKEDMMVLPLTTGGDHRDRGTSPPITAWHDHHGASDTTATVATKSYEWPIGDGTRVLIVTGVGTRGDVQPFLALALALLRTHRHRVVMSIPAPFESWVASFGIPTITHDIDIISRLRDTPEGAGYRLISHRKMLKRSDDFWRPVITAFLQHYLDVCMMTRPDIVVAGSMPAMCSPLPCELLSIPYIIMHHTPHHPTKFFSPPIAPIDEPSCAPCINRVKWNVAEVQGWKAVWRDGINKIRASQGRPIYKNDRGVEAFSRRDRIPVVYTYSPILLPKPMDWPDNEYVAGSMRMPVAAVDVSHTYVPSPQLQSFIGSDAHNYPVYIGFGSMLGVYMSQPQMIAFIHMLHASLHTASVRGIVCTTGCEQPPVPPSHVLHVTDVPHDWLFPRCSVIVHHGGITAYHITLSYPYILYDRVFGSWQCAFKCVIGAGTTQSSLLAGRASIVVAFGFDQPFWARRLAQLGAGVAAGTVTSLRQQILADAIRRVRATPAMTKMATDIGNTMRNEDGTTIAISVIDQHMADFTSGKLAAIMKFDITRAASSSCCTIM